jgi:hypothetical protein
VASSVRPGIRARGSGIAMMVVMMIPKPVDD